MATKPTKLTDWATDGAALTEATTVARHDLGWQTTPDNLVSQPGERPNLQQQNYWQLAVHEWSTYFEEVTDENALAITALEDTLSPPLAVEDMWEFDMPSLTTIRNSGGDLQFVSRGSISQASANNRAYAGCEPELMIVGHWMEVNENFNREVGFELIDASAVVWTVVPVAGPIGWETLAMEGNIGENNSDDDAQFIVKPNSNIEIYKDNVLIANFSTFSTLTTNGNIAAANPTGVRAVNRLISTLAFNKGGYSAIMGIKRKRYRPLNSIRFTGYNATYNKFLKMPCKLEDGRLYRFTYDFKGGQNTNMTLWIYNNDVSPESDNDDAIIDGIQLRASSGEDYSYWTSEFISGDKNYSTSLVRTPPPAYSTTGIQFYIGSGSIFTDYLSSFSDNLSNYEPLAYAMLGALIVEDV